MHNALDIKEPDGTDLTVTAELDGDPGPIIEYTPGSGVWATYGGPVTITEPGEYAMKFRARDAAGNVSDVGSADFVTLAAPPSGTVWLSDHPWMSAENGWGPVERDQSNGETAADDGRPLTIGGQTFEKGLGVHAPSNVTYYLGGACTQLTAQAGVDDEVRNNGKVIFRAIGDGEVLAETGALTGADGPEAFDVDVSGIDTVELVVGPNGSPNGSPTADHADWADLQVICEDVR